MEKTNLARMENELLSKDAVEAGAFLHGTLVSAEAPGQVRPKLDKLENFKAKRKVDCVYRLLYVMRKRSCSRSAEFPGIDFPGFLNPENDVGHDFQEDASPDNDFVLEKCRENHFNLHETVVDTFDCGPKYICSGEIVWNEFPREDSCLSVQELIEHGSPECADVISEQVCKVRHLGDRLTGSSSPSPCDFLCVLDPTSSPVNPYSPEPCERIMESRLNHEDPEIPFSNDILPGEASDSSLVQANFNHVLVLSPSFTNQRSCEPEVSLKQKGDDPAPIDCTPLVLGSDIMPKTSPVNRTVSGRDDYEVQDNKLDLVISTPNATLQEPSKYASMHGFPRLTSFFLRKEDHLDAWTSMDVRLHAEVSSTEEKIVEPAQNLSALYEEEFEGDDNISFPDVEALIRKMDLCPIDSDSFFNKEVTSLGHENAGRTIRLEQRIILGRSTSGFDVDIDLGREGCARRISRLQAVLKLEENGAFSLKNIGKSLIYVNGKELATGQILSLTSSSSIEIRGMTFAFEINEKPVRRYLKIMKKNEEKNKFEWTENGW